MNGGVSAHLNRPTEIGSPETKKVVSVRANEDFTLDLQFNDGSLRRFDAKPYLLTKPNSMDSPKRAPNVALHRQR